MSPPHYDPIEPKESFRIKLFGLELIVACI